MESALRAKYVVSGILMFGIQSQAPSLHMALISFVFQLHRACIVFLGLVKNIAVYFSFQCKTFCQLGPARTDTWQGKILFLCWRGGQRGRLAKGKVP